MEATRGDVEREKDNRVTAFLKPLEDLSDSYASVFWELSGSYPPRLFMCAVEGINKQGKVIKTEQEGETAEEAVVKAAKGMERWKDWAGKPGDKVDWNGFI